MMRGINDLFHRWILDASAESDSLHQPVLGGEVALILDGLDEARMRVTQDGFAAFMTDASELSCDSRTPIMLLGRTGAAQDAWVWLHDKGIEAPVPEIGCFDERMAIEFTKRQAQSLRDEDRQRQPDGRAALQVAAGG